MDEDFEEMTAEELAESAIGYMGELLDEMDFDSSYDDKSITVRAANGDKIVFCQAPGLSCHFVHKRKRLACEG